MVNSGPIASQMSRSILKLTLKEVSSVGVLVTVVVFILLMSVRPAHYFCWLGGELRQSASEAAEALSDAILAFRPYLAPKRPQIALNAALTGTLRRQMSRPKHDTVFMLVNL